MSAEQVAGVLRAEFAVDENVGEYDASAVWGSPEAIAAAIAPLIAAARAEAWDAAMSTAESYATDQSMAGAYFPEWDKCAALIKAMPLTNPYHTIATLKDQP